MSDQSGLPRRGFLAGALGAGLALTKPSEPAAQGVMERSPARDGYPRVTLDRADPLEAMDRGLREQSINRWHQRLILLAEDASPTQATAVLMNWAQRDALAGTFMDGRNSVSLHLQQSKLIAGAAMVYLRTKSSATPEQRATIESWLNTRTSEIRRFFDQLGDSHDYNMRNHATWAGLAAAATGMALDTNDRSGHYSWGRHKGQMTINRITVNGSIPGEEARPWEVLNPLFALVHLSQVRGDSLYAGPNRSRLEDAANWGMLDLNARLQNNLVQNRPGEQRLGTGTRPANVRAHDHAFMFAGLYYAHTRSTVAAELLQKFGYQANMEMTITSRRGPAQQRSEVPVLSHLGGALDDILSIGRAQGRGR